jgi:hypothetical protein
MTTHGTYGFRIRKTRKKRYQLIKSSTFWNAKRKKRGYRNAGSIYKVGRWYGFRVYFR